MALNPSAAYPAQINTTDPTGYPYGRAKNVTAIGDSTGTPLEEKWVSDLFGFEQSLLAFAGIVPSGVPDKVGQSDYLSALLALASTVGDARVVLGLRKSQGQNWSRSSFSNPTTVNSDVPIAYDPAPSAQGFASNGLLMATTGNTESHVSDDGVEWSGGSSFGGTLLAAAKDLAVGSVLGTRTFLASGLGNAKLIKTTDGGTTWTLASSSMPVNSVLGFNGGQIVAAGDSGVIKTSLDAATWTTQTTPAGWILGSGGVKRVLFANGLWVILPAGNYDKFLTSPDSINWTERAVVSGVWTGLAYGDGMWMAASAGSGLMVSTNGTAWTLQNTAQAANDLAVLGQLWVMPTAGGAYGGVAFSTNKGLSWQKVAVGDHRVATSGWRRIIVADSRFILARASGPSLDFGLSMRAL